LDPLLAMQLSPWVARGTPDLKRNIIGIIEELGDPAGGPAIRLAVLDDDEDIAVAAVRAMAAIRFSSASPLLVKAAQIRRKQHPGHGNFLAAVCDVLGEWRHIEAVPFLMEVAHKKSLLTLPGHAPSLIARLAAIQALGNFNSPAVWQFMEQLAQERNPELQEALNKVIQKRTGDI
jgi:HEAT repeat protein